MRNQIKDGTHKLKTRKQHGDKSQTSPKVFWSLIRKQMKVKTGVSPTRRTKNSIKYLDFEKANILQKQVY